MKAMGIPTDRVANVTSSPDAPHTHGATLAELIRDEVRFSWNPFL